MRNYVHEHPQYTHNSILSKKVMDDLLITLYKISKGDIKDKNFEKIFPDWELPFKVPSPCDLTEEKNVTNH